MNTTYDERVLHDFSDQHAVSIYEHSCAAPMLLVLVRHVGCAFCRKTLNELQDSLAQITSCGYSVGIVHMNNDETMTKQLEIFGLQTLPRFYDPGKVLYRALGLRRVSLSRLFQPAVIREGLKNHREYGSSFPEADPRQLPGAFLIDQGHVVAGETVLSPHDHPDFLSLLIYAESLNSREGACTHADHL